MMTPDPDPCAWRAFLADSYRQANYAKGLAAAFMRQGHQALERDFSDEDRFDQVLEVGGGEGMHLGHLRHGFGRYVLTDYDGAALERARRAGLPPGVVALRADARALPFADGSFDRVIAAHVLEHLPDPHLVLREWMRVLRPGGVLSILLPCDPGMAWRLGRQLGPRARVTAAGLPYDYWMAREHINPINNLLAYLRFYFPQRKERWLPTGIPWADINLFYVCQIRR